MRTRRHRNKTKNNRKRGGALGRGVTGPPTGTIRRAVEGVRNFTRKYVTCCRPGQQPNDGDGVAAAAGVGPALPPPGSPPFIRRARGSPGSPGSRGASCVPCPQGSSRPPSRPLPAIPSPSRSRSQTPSPSRSRSKTPSPPRVTMVSTEPTHRPVMQTCINFWRDRLGIMRTHMSHLQHYHLTSQVIREIRSTARQILVANISLSYWTDVLAGNAQGPRITDPDSMSDEEITRLLGYRTGTYARQLRNSISGLPPRVTNHNLSTFINL